MAIRLLNLGQMSICCWCKSAHIATAVLAEHLEKDLMQMMGHIVVNRGIHHTSNIRGLVWTLVSL